MRAMRIIVMAQSAFIGFLAVAGIITINFGRLFEIVTDVISWLADSASSIFSSILELGTFGGGIAAGYMATTVLLSKMDEE